MSLILVTPLPVGAVASALGVASALAVGDCSAGAGVWALLHAPTTAAKAAIAPTAASRWIFLNWYSTPHRAARLVRVSHVFLR
ncbi:MAG TPA: hypothetical protein VGP04_00360 [Pseudonocardiaceae bacterium]|jgi:hypothetical protein|nr:hypothetical protein [Pseudonocardiaceae bacterium]